VTGVTEQGSAWPPPDFYLEVEELRTAPAPFQVARRVQVWADGTVLYKKAPDRLLMADGKIALAVFSDACAYKLLPETTRLLARKVWRRGVLELDDDQGDHRGDAGAALHLRYRGHGINKTVYASGQIHGTLVRVLRTINAYLPPGEEFALPGMAGDKEPSTLRGVPAPFADLAGAFSLHQELLQRFGTDRTLMLDAFALACRAGDRIAATDLLGRFRSAKVDASGVPPPELAQLPAVTDELLSPLLPAK
jgi:hypothetical protein